jgi:hypothetical protein
LEATGVKKFVRASQIFGSIIVIHYNDRPHSKIQHVQILTQGSAQILREGYDDEDHHEKKKKEK